MGAPIDIESLHRTVTILEQQVVVLRGELTERDQELSAAQAATRGLMPHLNATGRPQLPAGGVGRSD
jgi:hypothetical protein